MIDARAMAVGKLTLKTLVHPVWKQSFHYSILFKSPGYFKNLLLYYVNLLANSEISVIEITEFSYSYHVFLNFQKISVYFLK